MANSPQSTKRARQAEKRRRHNQGIGTKFRTMVKRARAAAGKENAAQAFADMQSATDSAARKGIIHPRKAARLKRRTNALMRKHGSNMPAAKPAAAVAPAGAPTTPPTAAATPASTPAPAATGTPPASPAPAASAPASADAAPATTPPPADSAPPASATSTAATSTPAADASPAPTESGEAAAQNKAS